MVTPLPSSSSESSAPSSTRIQTAHPAGLEEADRPYFVPWGRTEIRRALGGFVALAGVTLVLAALVSPWWLLAALPISGLAAFLVLFFRNPARDVPSGPGLLVSPADGTVWDITEVDEPRFVQERCVRIGIFLSVFNVHVNRAPATGRVEWVEHRDGAYHDARSESASTENECQSVGLVRDDAGGPTGVRLLVKQISGAIARRIICPLEVPVSVARGGLIGMIKYGSRTELYVPVRSGVQIQVQVGDRVEGGRSVLAAWSDETAADEAGPSAEGVGEG